MSTAAHYYIGKFPVVVQSVGKKLWGSEDKEVISFIIEIFAVCQKIMTIKLNKIMKSVKLIEIMAHILFSGD